MLRWATDHKVAQSSPGQLPSDAWSPLLPADVPIVLYVDALSPGGTTAYAVALATGLRQRGHEVVAICSPSAAVATMREGLAAADTRVVTWDDGPATFRTRMRRVAWFASVLSRYPGCAVFLLMGYYNGGAPITLAARLARVGVLLRADLQPPIGPVARRARVEVRLRDTLVDRIIVGANDNVVLSAELLGRPPETIRVVNTGIDLSRFTPGRWREAIRGELGYGPSQLVVGMAARMGVDWERKGLGLFLGAAARVAGTRRDVSFLLAGDGTARSLLETRAAELGISDRVRFVGWRPDAAAIIDALDIFVMPSFVEGGPTIVLEAMAMGKAVIATRVGMVAEVIEHRRTGLIVAPGSLDELCSSLSELLADPDLRDALSGGALSASPAFDRQRMADAYLAEAERVRRRREGFAVNRFFTRRRQQPHTPPIASQGVGHRDG